MRAASVYVREGLWLVHSNAQTMAGFWISQEPYLAIPGDSDDAEIGTAVLRALDASQANVPNPDPDDISMFKPVLELAGVGGWRKFSQTAASIAVQAEKGRVRVTPMR